MLPPLHHNRPVPGTPIPATAGLNPAFKNIPFIQAGPGAQHSSKLNKDAASAPNPPASQSSTPAKPKPGDSIPAPMGLHSSFQGIPFIQAGPGARNPQPRHPLDNSKLLP